MSDGFLIKGYGGVHLTRLSRDDIELVRRWRNDPSISQHMVYRDYITPEMQERWFESVNNDRNYYCMIHYRGERVGVAEIKNIDWETRTGDGGIWIFDPQRREQPGFVYRASLPGIDYNFDVLGLLAMTATVLKENRRALRYNKSLGYEVVSDEPGASTVKCRLTRDAYYARRPALHAMFADDER